MVRSHSPPFKGRGRGGVCKILSAKKILTTPLTWLRPTVALLPPRNCLHGRVVAARSYWHI